MCLTLIHCLPLPTIIVAKHSPQTDDAKHRRLMPLSESIPLSQSYKLMLTLSSFTGCIHNTSFTSQLTNWHIKLECLSPPTLSNLESCNSLAYWAYSWVTKKMKCCEYGPCVTFHHYNRDNFLEYPPQPCLIRQNACANPIKHLWVNLLTLFGKLDLFLTVNIFLQYTETVYLRKRVMKYTLSSLR